jgi:hypothetical protein
LGLGKYQISKRDLAEMFVVDIAVDVWLMNYDAAGLVCDNAMEYYGDIYRLDNGGSLFYRARGKPKTQEEICMSVDKDLKFYFYGGSGGRDGYAQMMNLAGLHSPKDERFLEIWSEGVGKIEDLYLETRKFQKLIPDNPLLNQHRNEIISLMQQRLEIIRMKAL